MKPVYETLDEYMQKRDKGLSRIKGADILRPIISHIQPPVADDTGDLKVIHHHHHIVLPQQQAPQPAVQEKQITIVHHVPAPPPPPPKQVVKIVHVVETQAPAVVPPPKKVVQVIHVMEHPDTPTQITEPGAP